MTHMQTKHSTMHATYLANIQESLDMELRIVPVTVMADCFTKLLMKGVLIDAIPRAIKMK